MAVVYLRSDTLTGIRTPLCRTQLWAFIALPAELRSKLHLHLGVGRRRGRSVAR